MTERKREVCGRREKRGKRGERTNENLRRMSYKDGEKENEFWIAKGRESQRERENGFQDQRVKYQPIQSAKRQPRNTT